MENFEDLISQVNTHLDDPETLSRLCVKLSTYLYFHNTQVSKAELAETKTAVSLIDAAKENEGKLSVAEAEKRAVVQTGNQYGELKLHTDAITEVINSIKTRLKVLSLEYERK